MLSLQTMLPLSLLLAGHGVTALPQTHHVRDEGLQWGPCDLDTDLPVQCAKLPVPLDYTDKTSNKKLVLDLIKVPAAKQPSKGSILLNFGGPGQDGLNNMLSYAPDMGPATGGQHDLISWDPRATGKALHFSCLPSNATDDVKAAFSVLGTRLGTSSDVANGQLWAETSIIADACHSQLPEVGNLVGMSFVARDMMQIVDALKEDGMLRYWGISGGTTLGATVAAMFPDRMDRVMLDGVMNAHQYYNSFETEMYASADDTFKGFLAGCLEAPDLCPLAKRSDTAEGLLKIMLDFFEHVKYNPIPYQQSLIEYTTIKTSIFSLLYVPSHYSSLAAGLDDLLSGDPTAFIEAATGRASNIPSQDQAVLGIRCGDKSARTSNLAELEPALDEYLKHSKIFGDMYAGPYVFTCAQWQFEAKERYSGDFQVKTKNPLLFVGNTYDPITPLVSARNMSSGFDGSVVLHHDGFGHTSLAQPGNCTNDHIKAYFLDGTLPKPGTKCAPDTPLFAPDESS